MTQYHYGAPQYHVTTRDKIGPDLLQGIFPADRSSWGDDPKFLGWPAHLQRLHMTIADASARLVDGLETVLEESEGSVQEVMGLTGMNSLGLDLISHVHGHHGFEDANVLPGFLERFPQLSQAIDLLENDHIFLDLTLDQSELVFSKLNGKATSKKDIGNALEQAKMLNKILLRHTYDEEDILIPAVLQAYS